MQFVSTCSVHPIVHLSSKWLTYVRFTHLRSLDTQTAMTRHLTSVQITSCKCARLASLIWAVSPENTATFTYWSPCAHYRSENYRRLHQFLSERHELEFRGSKSESQYILTLGRSVWCSWRQMFSHQARDDHSEMLLRISSWCGCTLRCTLLLSDWDLIIVSNRILAYTIS